MPSKAQNRLLEELKQNPDRVIIEDEYKGTLSYTTAYISEKHHGYGQPRYCNKQTVWALLSLGLIKEKMFWGTKKGYILSNGGRQ